MVGIPGQGHSLRERVGRQLASASCRGGRKVPWGLYSPLFLGLPAPKVKTSTRDQLHLQIGLSTYLSPCLGSVGDISFL